MRRLDEQIHAAVDTNGLPVRLALSPGKRELENFLKALAKEERRRR
jgi:hypothetical protein